MAIIKVFCKSQSFKALSHDSAVFVLENYTWYDFRDVWLNFLKCKSAFFKVISKKLIFEISALEENVVCTIILLNLLSNNENVWLAF